MSRDRRESGENKKVHILKNFFCILFGHAVKKQYFCSVITECRFFVHGSSVHTGGIFD